MRHFINFRILGALALIGVLSVTGLAFTAGITLSDVFAGSGTSRVTGYTVSNATSTLSGIDAMSGKSFDLNGPATTVLVQFMHNGAPFGSLYSGHVPAQAGDACAITPTRTGAHVQCAFSPAVSLTQATDVAISATQ